jgi:hypothetical protein
MSVTETWPLSIDFTAYLSGSEAISSPVSTLVNTVYGTPVQLANSPSISGNIVTQIVAGPTDIVTPGRYLLTVNVTISSTYKPSTETIIVVTS